jgi:O-antigen/teichoic acid export membrane protein
MSFPDLSTKGAKVEYGFTSALNSVAKVIGGNIATSLISMVGSILVARWVIPSDMGVWNAAVLVTLYSPMLQLGVINGLNRELP